MNKKNNPSDRPSDQAALYALFIVAGAGVSVAIAGYLLWWAVFS